MQLAEDLSCKCRRDPACDSGRISQRRGQRAEMDQPAAAAKRKAGTVGCCTPAGELRACREHGDELPLFFYSDLFIKHPELRDMFPVSMAAQRGHLADALVKIVSQVDSVDELTAFLQGLGRDHRKFGVVVAHYGAVGDSLLATLEHFSGPAWTPGLAADWKTAYELIGSVMTTAARADEQLPAAMVAGYGRVLRAAGVRHFRAACPAGAAMDYLAGQSVAIESPSRPRLWRYYSMANAPRRDGLLEFHVRLIDGGAVSMALTGQTVAGAELRLGPPVGVAHAAAASPTVDLLLVAGSTGLAPLKAIARTADGTAAAAERAPVLRRANRRRAL